MNAVHYILEIYNIDKRCLGSNEQYENGCIIRVQKDLSKLYHHGTHGNNVYSRALRVVLENKVPLLPDEAPIVCWKPIKCTLDFDTKNGAFSEILERIFSSSEKVLLTKKLKEVLKDDASLASIQQNIPEWQKTGFYKNDMREFSLLLLQRTHILASMRAKVPCEINQLLLPDESFCVTTRAWIEPAFLTIAIKIAELITHINSNYRASCVVPKYSQHNPPAIQLERRYISKKTYIDACKTETEEALQNSTLDLLIHIISTTYTRSYWSSSKV